MHTNLHLYILSFERQAINFRQTLIEINDFPMIDYAVLYTIRQNNKNNA